MTLIERIAVLAIVTIIGLTFWLVAGTHIRHAAIEGCAQATAYRYAVQGYAPAQSIDLARIECQEASP